MIDMGLREEHFAPDLQIPDFSAFAKTVERVAVDAEQPGGFFRRVACSYACMRIGYGHRRPSPFEQTGNPDCIGPV